MMTAFDGISALPPEVFEIREKIKQRGCVVAETARKCMMGDIASNRRMFEMNYRGYFMGFIERSISQEKLEHITKLSLLDKAILNKVGNVALNKLSIGITGEFFSLMFGCASAEDCKDYIRVHTFEAVVHLSAELRKCYIDEIINSALDAFTPEVVRMPPIQSIGPYPKNLYLLKENP